MNTLKTILLTTLITLPFLLPAQQWRQVYENDAEGERISGSKAELLEAIDSGSEVRVGWRIQKDGDKEAIIQHFAMADLVSVLNEDQVFAQVSVTRDHVYKKRKEIMGFNFDGMVYLLSTTDSQRIVRIGSGETSDDDVVKIGSIDAVGKLKFLRNVRWFVR